jgi:hypothetical protein
VVQRRSIEQLDLYVDWTQNPSKRRRHPKIAPPMTFFADLVCGGLIRVLLQRTSSKQPLDVLRHRAAVYRPISPWHLHLDALETLAVSSGDGEVSGVELKRIAARRILSLLHSSWNPRNGGIYRQLSSDLAIIWSLANDEQRSVIADVYEKKFPGRFDIHMAAPAAPDWKFIGVEPDIASVHVHRLLFALAAAPDFLVADRFDIWCLELATAGVAMYALAWTDPHNTLKDKEQPEIVFWKAIEMLLLDNVTADLKLRTLRKAMRAARAPWSEAAGDVLLKAGEGYRESMRQNGVDLDQVAALVEAAWRIAPNISPRTACV